MAAWIPANEDDEMKAQQIGLVLGMNVVAACLMMQGCKATRPGAGGTAYKPVEPVVVEDRPATPEPPAVQRPVVQVSDVPEPAPAPAPKTPVVKPVAPVADKPAVAPSPAPRRPAPVAVGEVYVVQKGDSLSKISKRFNVKLNAIVAANPGIKPNKIRIGQKVKIPGVTANAVAAAAPSAAKKPQAVVPASASAANLNPPVKGRDAFKPYTGATKAYVVKSGDTLGGIAHDSGITVRVLKELNGLDRNTVRIGQELKIPAEKQVAAAKTADAKKSASAKADGKKTAADGKKPASDKPASAKAETKKPSEAEPASKDSAGAEAAATVSDKKADVEDSSKSDKSKSDAGVLTLGEESKAGNGDKAALPSAGTHTVKEGEDLVSIAIEHSISPSSLMEVNDLKVTETDKVTPGMVLKLPANAK